MFKKDNFIYGLALGLVAPIFGFMFYKFVKFNMYTINEMFQFLKSNPNLITVFISISLVANAILFTIFINGHRDKTAKGIFTMTIIYASIAMGFRYL